MDLNSKWALICQSKKKERAEGQEAKAVYWVAKLRDDPTLVLFFIFFIKYLFFSVYLCFVTFGDDLKNTYMLVCNLMTKLFMSHLMITSFFFFSFYFFLPVTFGDDFENTYMLVCKFDDKLFMSLSH